MTNTPYNRISISKGYSYLYSTDHTLAYIIGYHDIGRYLRDRGLELKHLSTNKPTHSYESTTKTYAIV